MNSNQITIYNNKSRYEKHNWDPLLDVLTNSEYLTFTAKPSYSIVIPCVMILSQDILRKILKYIQNRNYSSELSTRTVRRLKNSILYNNDFTLFQFIYDTEYMRPNILAWFEYNTSQSSECNFYPLCECRYKNPIKIHNRSFTQCKCLNGKRYLAFKIANINSIFSTYIGDVSKQIKNYILASGAITHDHELLKI